MNKEDYLWKQWDYDEVVLSGGDNIFRANHIHDVHEIKRFIVDNPVSNRAVLEFSLERGVRIHPDTVVYINDFILEGDNVLEVRFRGEGKYWLRIKDQGDKTLEAIRRIAIESNACETGGKTILTKAKYRLQDGYYTVTHSTEPWSPVPEPSTYGAVFSLCALGVGVLKQCRRKKAAPLK